MHVAVVGGGVFGTAMAWRLAVRGHSVTLIEATGFGHAGSASGDKSRIVRALYDDAAFAASGHASLALWDAWSEELGERLIERVGVLYLNDAGPAAEAFRRWVDQGIGHVRRLGGVAEELEPAEVARRFPAVKIDGLARGVFEPAGGYGRVALAARVFALAAKSTGRVEHLPVRATAVRESSGAASGVAFQGGSVEAELVIVCAGFDGAALVAPFTGDLGIRRLPHWTSYFKVTGGDARNLEPPRMPCWADLGNGLYGFPDDGKTGLKVAWHEPRRDHVTGHEITERPTDAQIDELRLAAARRFPAFARGRCVDTFPCAYDATADESFRIGPVPGTDRLWFVGGLSGHGFKHAPAITESIASMVSGGRPAVDLEPFAWTSRG